MKTKNINKELNKVIKQIQKLQIHKLITMNDYQEIFNIITKSQRNFRMIQRIKAWKEVMHND